MIAQVLRDALSGLGLRFPDDDPSLASLKVE